MRLALLVVFFAFTDGSCTAQPSSTRSLPAPSGTHAVGTSTFHLVDSTRTDFVQNTSDVYRELMVQVWYPAEETGQERQAPYVPTEDLLDTMKEDGYMDLPADAIESWRSLKIHAQSDAPFAQNVHPSGVLFFSHGLGLPRFHYTSLLQDLASHGYIIVAIDHPYGGLMQLPDGRTLSSSQDPADLNAPPVIAQRTHDWSADASFVLDRILSRQGLLGRFAQNINQDHVGMFGHSLGGSAALEACINDSRFKACVTMDGAPFGKVEHTGIQKPTLMLGSGPDYSDEDLAALGRTREQWEQMGEQYMSVVESILTLSDEHPGYLISIKGTGHMSYSDAPFVMPETISRFGGRIIAPNRGFEIMTTYLRSFFDQYLLNQPGDLFQGNSERYPEASVHVFNR